jgi:hypothetical protein
MKTEAEFAEFYTDVLEKKIPEQESRRLSAKFNYQICAALIICIVVVVFVWSFAKGGLAYMPPAIICCLPFAYLIFRASTYFLVLNYKQKFREDIVSEIIHFYGGNLKYDPDGGIPFKAVDISCIFDQRPGDYTSNDYVEGKIGDVGIQFSEIHVHHSLYGINTKFNGLFVIAQFNKHFNGEYLVHPERYEKLVGKRLGKAIENMGSSLPPVISMENPEFEKAFTVYGLDEIEARYLITPGLMVRMLNFRNKVNEEVYFSFMRSHFFIAIGTDKEAFEPPLFQSVDFKTLENWNRSLFFALSLVDDLNLNTRIWSKH